MAELDPNVLFDISAKVSAIAERTLALQDADRTAQEQANHRHRNVMAAMENFVPRREIEAEFKDVRTYTETLAEQTQRHCDSNREAIVGRVATVEKSLADLLDGQKHIRRAVIGAVITGIIGLLFAIVRWGGPMMVASLHHS